jgi:ABC-type antimicrobial peptide transport system permease subunit
VEEAPGETNPRIQIVGIVADTKYRDLRESLPPIAYLASTQEKEPASFVQVVLRSDVGPAGVTAGITQAVRRINPAIGVQFQTMETLIRDSLTGERLMAALSGVFAALAVVISTIGLYGVMSYMVERRRMEIGIRMALGATAGNVLRLILRENLALVVVGAVLGVACSLTLTRVLHGFLAAGVSPLDPLNFAAMLATLILATGVAVYFPARRATRVDPLVVLRHE